MLIAVMWWSRQNFIRNQGIVNAPPRDKVIVFGDGNTKGVFNKEVDVGTFTLIKAVNDPRTLNKILYIIKAT
ncbi:hypothetical protein ACOSQ4_011079 [Xanthoceras sorbifolium]